MKKTSIPRVAAILVSLSGALAGCANSTVELSADYPEYSSLSSAFAAADDVVVAKYVSSRTEIIFPAIQTIEDPVLNPQYGIEISQDDMDAMAVVTTVSTMQVIGTVSGSIKEGEYIEVSQLGGVRGEQRYEEKNTHLFSDYRDSEVVLFLAEHPGHPYDLINPSIGLVKVQDGRLETFSDDAEFNLRSADVDTIEELVRFAENALY